MTGLRDIARLEKDVELRDGAIKLTVYGISAGGLARALGRSGEAERALGGVSYDMGGLMGTLPSVLQELLAEALDVTTPDDRALLENLTAEEQETLLSVAVEMSFPNGLGPFVARAIRLLGLGGSGSADPATTSSTPLMN